ncbi:hypothetical protein [Nocardia sp. NPDC050175]|uniref:hypothetical protein n=1 Tax=Nocardia sp. NPDC050175 TaxID=3364317 RepID=UPI0037AD52D3
MTPTAALRAVVGRRFLQVRQHTVVSAKAGTVGRTSVLGAGDPRKAQRGTGE